VHKLAVTETVAIQKNFRIAEYFLCPECEDRLNKGGESWVLQRSYRGGESFPLREALAKAPTVYPLNLANVVDARSVPNVVLQKIVYFAIGVFWKASARKWWGVDHLVQLDFGPYELKFRQFLLGNAALPDTIAIGGRCVT
jgi:hypothetical protein